MVLLGDIYSIPSCSEKHLCVISLEFDTVSDVVEKQGGSWELLFNCSHTVALIKVKIVNRNVQPLKKPKYLTDYKTKHSRKSGFEFNGGVWPSNQTCR